VKILRLVQDISTNGLNCYWIARQTKQLGAMALKHHSKNAVNNAHHS